MDGILGWLVKLLFFTMLAPFFICLVLQLFVGIAAAILPWMLLGFALAGLVFGLTAGLAFRRLAARYELSGAPRASLAGQHRIRRPKGGRGREED
jgi:hypothetical protein